MRYAVDAHKGPITEAPYVRDRAAATNQISSLKGLDPPWRIRTSLMASSRVSGWGSVSRQLAM